MDKFDISLFETERWFSLDNFDGEIWKDVVGYKGNYTISNFGRVKSVARTSTNYDQKINERIMKQGDHDGYKTVVLYYNGDYKNNYVHRLVAEHFIPNQLSLPHINHRDENKSNNCVDNLEWCTPNYNNKYGTARERLEKSRRDNGNVQQIDMYDLNGNFLKHYGCALDLEKDGISRRAVYNVCNYRTRSYKGCVFRFSGDKFSYRKENNSAKGDKKRIVKADINGNIIKVYESVAAAQRENGLKRNYLYSATYAYTRKALINGYYFYAD